MKKLSEFNGINYSQSEEWLKTLDGHNCKTTKKEKEKVDNQVNEVYGKCKTVISPMGYVFAESEGDVYFVGRVDANFNFYAK